MGMEATSLSRTLKSLEEKKLIERKPNPIDGRSVLIYLTVDGYTNEGEVLGASVQTKSMFKIKLLLVL